QLALRILRTPETTAPESTVLEGFEAPGLSTAGERGDTDLAQALQVEILRNQAVLYNLDQDRSATQENPQLHAQIQYQKRRMSRLEDGFRSLPEVQPRLLESVQSIASRIRTASNQPRTVSRDEPANYTLESVAAYVDQQAEALKQELSCEKPNQLLISASLGATLAVADRLHTDYGDTVINAEDVKQLAALVPTVAGKVVL